MAGPVSILKCNASICPVTASWFGYRPSLAMNATFLSIFIIALVLHTVFYYRYRTTGFSICMCIGCALEVSGYVGRILAHFNPWSLPAFFVQINGIGLAPTFFAAGIYLCLTRIVIAYGAGISRVQPKVYTYVFILCDIGSLVIQLPGGVLSSMSASKGREPTTGAHIGLAGVCFQVFALSIWVLLAMEFAVRCWMAGRSAWEAKYERMRDGWRFIAFLAGLGLAVTTLYARSVYRIVELREGYTGRFARDEIAFFVLEGLMILVLSLVTAVFHPGFGFGEMYQVITEQKATYPSPWKRRAFFMKDLTGTNQLVELTERSETLHSERTLKGSDNERERLARPGL
ncbi:hypothetical protein DRE_01050 [Drechslerella stenobrocha 248]|uniref:Sphingoid long-chain base transporter RSB1 n=1 Tax=Drechslerella stenobrocha 248 TaxID=1043628 RepID=W7HLY8_9PEZI|nr:hypothetical protein DRE_01050 [Drechslerella stenobrocha 248]